MTDYIYECKDCGARCFEHEMKSTAGIIETKYCCPHCYKPHRTIDGYRKIAIKLEYEDED